MYQRVFVPVDDSETSNLALVEACKFVKEINAQMRLVHVVDLVQFGWGGAEFMDSANLHETVKQAGKQVLEQALTIAIDHGLKPEYQVLESWGDKIVSVLLENSKNWGADLVVMGTHGWSGLMHVLMGSVAEGLLKQLDIPILMIRNNKKE